MEHEAAVGHAGQHHGHVHATFRGRHQRVDRLLVRHEVGGGDVDGFLGFLDGQDIRLVDFKAAVRLAGHDAHQLVAHFRQGWEIIRVRQVGLVLLGPGADEQPLEGGHGRAFHFHVGIAPAHVLLVGGFRFRTEQRAFRIGIADIDAARKRRLAVDDQHLAVVAVVDLPVVALEPGGIDGVEGHQVHAGRAHALEEGLRHAEGAHAVIDDVDRHARLLLFDQHVGELQAQRILVEDIRFQVDAGLRVADGLEHGGHGLRAVKQQGHLVALDQRHARGRLFQRGLGFQVHAGLGPALVEQGGPAVDIQQGALARDHIRLGHRFEGGVEVLDIGQRGACSQGPAQQYGGETRLHAASGHF